MKQLTINDFLTSREASKIYGQHENTINRNIKKYFKEGVDYRKMEGREKLLISKACLDHYYSHPEDFVTPRVTVEKTPIPDRAYRI